MRKKGKTKTVEEVVREKAEELLSMLSLTGNVEAQETEETIYLSIQPEEKDSSLLIGYHGENLESFQLILSFLANKELEEFKRIVVNVGDYRERREEKLREIALHAKEEAIEKNGEVVLPDLSSSDRRIIHLLFQDDEEVSSESVGEGRDRQLVIKPKKRA